MKRSQLPRFTERRGAVTVEFALVVPIILLLFFGALDIASMNFARHTIGFAAYEGARKAAIPGNTATHATTEAIRQMGLVGLGTGAAISVTQTNTAVTVSIEVPSSGSITQRHGESLFVSASPSSPRKLWPRKCP